MSNIRLYVDHPLADGQTIPLDRGQAHYLFGVMRLSQGDIVHVFNGTDGEWRATVSEAGKRGGLLTCDVKTRDLMQPPDLWLLFSPIKKARTDFIVEKAAELGVSEIVPVITEFTNSERVRVDRLQAHAVEAAEQCGATFVPTVREPVKFTRLLDTWDQARSILFCDEDMAGAASALPTGLDVPVAILIGPEGGFSPAERRRLHEMDSAHAVSLGPRILRADTAAVAAITLWQANFGDWG